MLALAPMPMFDAWRKPFDIALLDLLNCAVLLLNGSSPGPSKKLPSGGEWTGEQRFFHGRTSTEQAGCNRVGSNAIDLPENVFGLLAAICRALRQFSLASRLKCGIGWFPHLVWPGAQGLCRMPDRIRRG